MMICTGLALNVMEVDTVCVSGELSNGVYPFKCKEILV